MATVIPDLTALNLDQEYPRITVPDDMLPDHDADEQDATYQQGMGIAAEISKEMLTKGRVRYSSEDTAKVTTTQTRTMVPNWRLQRRG